MDIKTLLKENEKLVKEFGAGPLSTLKDLPDFYTFEKKLIYSHRDFDKYYKAIKEGKKCAIVSGFNASGVMHLGHKVVFDTNLFFQKHFGVPVFIPISDDESYVTGKVESQETALKYSLKLAREILAYGFDPEKTFFIIDQLYTNIYNLAIKLSTKVTLSEIKATYGYKMENNPGLFFYPAVQSAHVLLPMEFFDFDFVLVPIGPDEDSHLRICRDIASRISRVKPAVLHLSFMPGIDGEKMSKSRNNTIFLFEEHEKEIAKKVNKAISGGAKTLEEHKKFGGDPEKDIACFYLEKYFLDKAQAEKLFDDYRKGTLSSKDVKKMLSEKMIEFTQSLQSNLKKINFETVYKCLLKNPELTLEKFKDLFAKI